MDEKSIRQTAAEAINDLELDCEVRDVGRSPKGDEWRVQFSGSYSPFCDKFQDQFERDNSLAVVREKIKRHLLGQVEKIRRSTGKSRRPKVKPAGTPQAESSLFTAPLKMIGDALGSASQFAGDVIERAAGVADAARQTVANASDEIVPVKIAVSGSSSTVMSAKKSRQPLARKTGKTKKAQTKRAVRTTRKTSGRTSKKAKKQAKKARKTAAKSSGKAKKAATKKAKKVRR